MAALGEALTETQQVRFPQQELCVIRKLKQFTDNTSVNVIDVYHKK